MELTRRVLAIGIVSVVVATFPFWHSGVVLADTQGHLKQKIERAKSLIQDRAHTGENVSVYVNRMNEVGTKLRAGKRQQSEQLLDQVLTDLENGETGRTVADAGSGQAVAEGDIKSKVKRIKALLKERRRTGKDVSAYVDRMKEAGTKLRAGERKEGEQLLDQVLADLRTGAGGAPGASTREALMTSKWSTPERVAVRGYDRRSDHKMEVGVSPDGTMLFFNNSNKTPSKTDLFYATRVGDNDTLFEYGGRIAGANKSGKLDGTAAYRDGKLAFVSSRVEPPALHWGSYTDGKMRDVKLVPINLDKGFYALDPEIATNWDTLFFAYRQWTKRDYMEVSFAHWDGQRYAVADNWQEIMANVNTDAMEYAPDVSSDQLEIWFTRHTRGTGAVAVYGATRKDINEPFTNVGRHPTITGPAEAPTLTADDNTMYYHCMDLSTKTWEICVTRRQ